MCAYCMRQKNVNAVVAILANPKCLQHVSVGRRMRVCLYLGLLCVCCIYMDEINRNVELFKMAVLKPVLYQMTKDYEWHLYTNNFIQVAGN